MPGDLNEQASMLLQGIDADIQKRIEQGESVYEAQFRTLYERQQQYAALSPEWRWFQSRVEGAYHTLLQHERITRQGQKTEQGHAGRSILQERLQARFKPGRQD